MDTCEPAPFLNHIKKIIADYQGYQDIESRKKSLASFSNNWQSHIHKHLQQCEKQLEIWEESPEFVQLTAKIDEIIALQKALLDQSFCDFKDLASLTKEHYLFDENYLVDVLKIDCRLLQTLEEMQIFIDQIQTLTSSKLEQWHVYLDDCKTLFQYRYQMFFTLDQYCHLLQKNVGQIQSKISESTLEDEDLMRLDAILSKEKNRIGTHTALIPSCIEKLKNLREKKTLEDDDIKRGKNCLSLYLSLQKNLESWTDKKWLEEKTYLKDEIISLENSIKNNSETQTWAETALS